VRIALYQPDIPQNTGTILRLGACLGISIEIIGPTGFDMSDRSMRRAGLDYLDLVSLQRHLSFETFDVWRRELGLRLVLLTTRATTSHLDHQFEPSDILMLGRESVGVPESIHAAADARIRIPMRTGLRSLNIAVSAAIGLGEALRQTNGYPRHGT